MRFKDMGRPWFSYVHTLECFMINMASNGWSIMTRNTKKKYKVTKD
jgi:hypothetical protein